MCEELPGPRVAGSRPERAPRSSNGAMTEAGGVEQAAPHRALLSSVNSFEIASCCDPRRQIFPLRNRLKQRKELAALFLFKCFRQSVDYYRLSIAGIASTD